MAPGGRLLIEATEGRRTLARAVTAAGLTATVTGCADLDATVVTDTRHA